jgi:hypothetical protein
MKQPVQKWNPPVEMTTTAGQPGGVAPVGLHGVVSTPTVLPPDNVKNAMLKLYEALQECKKADWKTAPVSTRMNAKTMINRLDELVC